MKKVIGIFAHPDDEALGPSGTLALLAKENDVFLISVTSGEAAGKTPAEKETISKIRQTELLKSAQTLGIKEVFFLGYKDGTLNNELYHQIAGDIEKHVKRLRPETLLTFEMRGVSGHLDHIAVSMITTYVFQKYSFLKKLMYFGINKTKGEKMTDYFIYFPPGYERKEVDEVIDVSSVLEQKIDAIKCHQSQSKDIERTLNGNKKFLKEEYFFILKK